MWCKLTCWCGGGGGGRGGGRTEVGRGELVAVPEVQRQRQQVLGRAGQRLPVARSQRPGEGGPLGALGLRAAPGLAGALAGRGAERGHRGELPGDAERQAPGLLVRHRLP